MKSILIPGLLLEYTINGILLFAIFMPVAHAYDSTIVAFLKENVVISTIVLLPTAFIVGMLIDTVVYNIVKYRKPAIHTKEMNHEKFGKIYEGATKLELEKYVASRSTTDKLVIELLLRNADNLANEVKQRSTRDRIARGLIFNALISSIISLTLLFTKIESFGVGLYVLGVSICIALAVAFYFIWERLEKLSFRFQLLTFIQLKNNGNKKSTLSD